MDLTLYFLELHCLDAAGTDVQANDCLCRSKSEHASPRLSSGHSSRCPGLLLGALWFSGRTLLFHPLVQNGLLEFPAIAQLEGRDLLFVHVFVERVRTYAEVLRRLADIHHFTRICAHRCLALSSKKMLSIGFSRPPESAYRQTKCGIASWLVPKREKSLPSRGELKVAVLYPVYSPVCQGRVAGFFGFHPVFSGN